jgi:threonine dehydrogenase-like Zn-dependent dehydrogenase
VRVPFADAMLVGLPGGVAPEAVAGASDNLSDAWRTVAPSLLGDAPGAEALVVGGGACSIGLYAVAAGRALGASRVAYLDADRGRLAVAERLGGRGSGGPLPPRMGAGQYPVTVDASGDPAGVACALRSTASWGRCTSVGIYWTDVALPLLEMYGRGVVFVTGHANARADLPAVLAKVADGTLDPTPVHTGIYRWEDAPRVMTTGEMKPVFVRGA